MDWNKDILKKAEEKAMKPSEIIEKVEKIVKRVGLDDFAEAEIVVEWLQDEGAEDYAMWIGDIGDKSVGISGMDFGSLSFGKSGKLINMEMDAKSVEGYEDEEMEKEFKEAWKKFEGEIRKEFVDARE